MRDETRRKLDRHLALRRGARWLAIILVALALAAFAFLALPASTVREIEAEVRVAFIGNDGKRANPYTTLELKLPDGRIVMGRSTTPLAPRAGARIIVQERSTLLGFRSYEWDGRTP